MLPSSLTTQGLVTLTFIEPMLAPLGSMVIENVPVTDNVCVARLKLALLEVVVVSVVPSGLSNLTVTLPMVLAVTGTVTCCPDVPLKVTVAFCPGTVVVTLRADPPIVTLPVGSAGTSYSVSVMLPVLVLFGLIRMVYVPFTGNVLGSMNALLTFETSVEDPNTDPSGL